MRDKPWLHYSKLISSTNSSLYSYYMRQFFFQSILSHTQCPHILSGKKFKWKISISLSQNFKYFSKHWKIYIIKLKIWWWREFTMNFRSRLKWKTKTRWKRRKMPIACIVLSIVLSLSLNLATCSLQFQLALDLFAMVFLWESSRDLQAETSRVCEKELWRQIHTERFMSDLHSLKN